MKIETININDIHPAPYNPRIMPPSEMLKLEKGLQTFGLVDPIIIDLTDKNTVIGGHQRLEALKNINQEMNLNLIRLGDIGWIFENKEIKIKDKNDQKALNLALNKINGDWDYGKLDDLLTELNDEHYLLELTGFDEVDLIPDNNMFDSDWELLDDIEDEDDASAETYNNNVNETENTTNDETPSETPYTPLHEVEVKIKSGEKWKLGNHTLYCADSSNMENIQELISEEKIDLILTDAPYGINIVQTTKREREETNGTVGITAPPGFTGTVGVKGAVKAKEYKPVYDDDKPFDPENILKLDVPSILFGANNFSSKLPDNSRWIVWHKKPYDDTPNQFSDCELAWTNFNGKQVKYYHYLWKGLLREGNRKDELKARVHPTQKPVGLLKNIINDVFTEHDKNILDLYGGSGSTLIACESTDNNCYMMEIDPYYCQIIINRWEEYTGQKAEKIQ